MSFRFYPLPLCIALISSVAQAQSSSSLTPSIPALSASAEPLATPFASILKFSRLGLNRQIVDVTTQALANDPPGKPNRTLLYWRGLARRRVILLDGAKKDLQFLGDYKPPSASRPASEILAEVNELLALRPPHEHIVYAEDGKTVLFRVYSHDDDEFLRTVLGYLPTAYKTASDFTGLQTDEIPLFVFNNDHQAEFVKFFSTLIGQQFQTTWTRTVTYRGTITVSQRTIGSVTGRPANDPRLLYSLSHEITHQLTRGLIGSSSNAPRWFTEGIAEFSEGFVDPTLYPQNDATIRSLVAQNAILGLDQIEEAADFKAAESRHQSGEETGKPYVQGLSMTRFLVQLLKEEKMPAFLQRIRQKESFDAALKKATGLSPQQFYNAWKKTLPPRPLERP